MSRLGELPRVDVHCSGCGRPVGRAVTRIYRVWCRDATCPALPPSNKQDARDDLVYLLHRSGRSVTELARIFEISRQRIDQIINRSRGSTE